MKKILFLMLLFAATDKAFSQGNYKYLFTRNGVEVYEQWSCSGCIDQHLQLKLVNTNSYKVTVIWEKFEWQYNGVTVKKESGQMFDMKAGSEQHGDYAGLWYYPPNGYTTNSLRFQLTNFTVKKTDN